MRLGQRARHPPDGQGAPGQMAGECAGAGRCHGED